MDGSRIPDPKEKSHRRRRFDLKDTCPRRRGGQGRTQDRTRVSEVNELDITDCLTEQHERSSLTIPLQSDKNPINLVGSFEGNVNVANVSTDRK